MKLTFSSVDTVQAHSKPVSEQAKLALVRCNDLARFALSGEESFAERAAMQRDKVFGRGV